MLASAEGATLTLDNGRQIVDLAAGGLGYAQPVVLRHVREQIERVPLSTQLLMNRPLVELLGRVSGLLPAPLSVMCFQNSAAEAIDGAIRLALSYHPDRRRVVTARGRYHGSTLGCLSATGTFAGHGTFLDIEPAVVEFGDAEAAVRAIDETTAAVLLEPFASAAGLTIPAVDYFPTICRRCLQTGALFICDEVVTGLGRTGTLLAVEQHGIVPDILVLGDALGGSVVPVGVFVASSRVFKRAGRHSEPLLYGTTTSGSPLACAAAVASLTVIEQQDVAGRASRLGASVARTLDRWRGRYPQLVIRTTAIGLLASIGMPGLDEAVRIQALALKSGCLIRVERDGERAWLGLRPPLLIAEDELQRGLAIFEEALAIVSSTTRG